MRFIQNVLKFIQTRGVSDKNDSVDQMTMMLNTLSFATLSGGVLLLVLNALIFKDIIYASIIGMAVMFYAFLIVLHHFKQLRIAKIYFATIVPLWYSIMILAIGGFFSQSIAGAACVFNASMMFKKSRFLRRGLVLYNLLLFILPTVYTAFYSPFFGVRNILLDEILIFLLCVGWISIIFSKYENKTAEYISFLKLKNKELEQKTIELERFNHIASHDLKSPLRSIGGFMTLLKRDK